MSGYDFGVIAIYLVCMLSIGFVFQRFNRNEDDFFRGDGSMLWWLCGASAFMTSFSAWSFTGAAGKVYEVGLLVMVLYVANAIAFFLTWAVFSYRFRQLRVVTYVEGIRDRFGRFSEQFYTWFEIPLGILSSGLRLNAIAIFVAAALQMDFKLTIIALGVVIVVIALLGGAWAVVAGDFVQMLLVGSVTVVAAYLALNQPAIGGLASLLEKVPESYFRWSDLASSNVVGLWIAAVLLSQLVAINNMGESAARFIMVRDSKSARKAALIPMFGILLAPLVWIIPAMAAKITHPNLAADFPALSNPNEAAFVAVCMDVLPTGMLGLLVCGIFSATLANMDSGLNRNAGLFVMNFYKPFIAPEADPRKLLWVGRVSTVVLGIMIIAVAVLISLWRTMNLFDLVIRIAAAITVPLAVPMLFGLLHKKSPPHVAWCTALFGMLLSLALPGAVSGKTLAGLFGISSPTLREVTDLFYAANMFLVLVGCTACYWIISWLGKRHPDYERRVEAFFQKVNTPVVVPPSPEADANDIRQYRVLSRLCLVYGSLILLGILIPNPLWGRMCFLFCAGVMLGFGGVLAWLGRLRQQKDVLLPSGSQVPRTAEVES